MKQLDADTERRLLESKIIRDGQVAIIRKLWAEYCQLRGKPVIGAELDRLINERFSVEDGINSLAFESIKTVIDGLRKSIQTTKKEQHGKRK